MRCQELKGNEVVNKQINFILVFICLISSSFFTIEAENLNSTILEQMESSLINEDFGSIIAQTSKKKNPARRNKRQEIVNSWKPYWIANRYIEPLSSYFFNVNVGCGFLYFSSITANIQPTFLGATGELGTNNPLGQLKGKLGYNRTPVIEGVLGTKIWSWFSVALSYLHQGNINIQTKAQFYGNVVPSILATGNNVLYTLKAKLNLDAILAKVYFSTPTSMIWKKIAYTPYFGAALGPGWQAWSDINLEINDVIGANQAYKQKISSNAVWFVDLGTKLRSVIPNINFSVNLGAKLIGWGQARQIGLITQQGGATRNDGLVRPFKVKFVYSIAPYMGVQWNY